MHTMEYYLAIKENKVQIHATAQVNLENIQHERSQPQKTTYYVIPYGKYQKANLQRQKMDWWLTPAGALGGIGE